VSHSVDSRIPCSHPVSVPTPHKPATRIIQLDKNLANVTTNCHVLTQVQRHEDLWRVAVRLHAFLTPAVEGREWTVSFSDHFSSGKTSPRSPPNRMLGGLSSHLGAVQNKKKTYLFRELNPQFADHLTLSCLDSHAPNTS
jgi:hypothetical protein